MAFNMRRKKLPLTDRQELLKLWNIFFYSPVFSRGAVETLVLIVVSYRDQDMQIVFKWNENSLPVPDINRIGSKSAATRTKWLMKMNGGMFRGLYWVIVI